MALGLLYFGITSMCANTHCSSPINGEGLTKGWNGKDNLQSSLFAVQHMSIWELKY